MFDTTRRQWLTSLVILVLAATFALAWYQFRSRFVRPFSQQPTLFSGDAIALPAALAGPGPIRLVHLRDPSCPCNVGNEQHLAQLVAAYTGPVAFYVVDDPSAHPGPLPSGMQRLGGLPGMESIPATPAVAIFDRHGVLAYVGPYSEGVTCNSDNSFIEPVLKALLDDRPVHAVHTLAVGCYCPWAPYSAPAANNKEIR